MTIRSGRTLRSITRRALATAGALGLLVPAGTALAQDVPIGAIVGLTGGLAPYSPPIVDAAQLAVDQVNEAGGVLEGRQLELIVVDDQTNPQASVDAAQRLVSVDNVVGIVGPLGSGQVLAVANSVAVPDGVPLVAPTATSPELTTLEDDDLIFRTVVSDVYSGEVLADVVRQRGLERVALVYANNDYGVGLAQSFRDSFTAAGGTITGDAAVEPSKASYRSELATAATGDPQALVLIAYPADGGNAILRQSLENGFFGSFILTDGMKDQSVIDEIGAASMEGTFGVAPEAPGETDALKAFESAYSAASEAPLDSLFIRETYDATMLLALAIAKAGSTDRLAVRDALRDVANPPGEVVVPGDFARARELIAAGTDINYEGAAGPHDFDAAGDVAGTVGVFEIRDGAFETVEVLSSASGAPDASSEAPAAGTAN